MRGQPHLDPGVALFLDALRGGAPPGEDVAAMRASAVAIRSRFADPPATRPPEDARIGTGPRAMSAAIHRSGSRDGPTAIPGAGTILYLHGGGWVLLDPGTHAPIMRRLARASGCDVVGLDHPLAPGTQFPESLEAVREAICEVADHPATWGLGPGPLILAGDSSGANLAVAAAMRLRNEGGPRPAGLILAYGVYDANLRRPSYEFFGGPPFSLTAERMDWFWRQYCLDPADRRDPLASPLQGDLAGLPPTFLAIAEQDALRDENLAMVDAMRAAGVAVAVERQPGAAHGFWEAAAVSAVASASIARAGAWAAALIHHQESAA